MRSKLENWFVSFSIFLVHTTKIGGVGGEGKLPVWR